MSSVDNRIVNMQFNNKQFTAGAAESQRALEGLDKTIANTGKGGGLATMANGVEQVTGRFSAMKVAGIAAVATIASKATTAGLSLIKSFTIDPIAAGFKEYNTNLQSTQTIMANTGANINEVKGYLGELNKYSDQTIYNFSEMAKNIGTFTAAGVELGTATASIKGISNLAALSGSSAQQASTAMYQLSQAIASGRVGLQDWNSVVNAGIGGKIFKNALAQTSVAMGGLAADAVKVGTDVTIMGDSFRQSIAAKPGSDSWLTSDVLVKTLANLDGRFSSMKLKIEGVASARKRANMIDDERIKLAKEGIVYTDKEFKAMVKNANQAYKAATQIKSGTQLLDVLRESIGSIFSSSFTIILGDLTQSKKVWGAVGDAITGPNGIISNISSSFLGMLKIWEHRGGRDKVIEGLSNAFGSLLKVLHVVTDAWRDVFPKSKIPGENISILFRLSKAFKAFTKNLIPSKATLENLQSIFGAFFAVLHIGFSIISGVTQGFAAFFGAIFSGTEKGRGSLLSFVAGIAETIKSFADFVTKGGKLTDFLHNLGTVAGKVVAGTIGPLISAIKNFVTGIDFSPLLNAFDRVQAFFTSLATSVNLSGIISQVRDFVNGLDFSPLLDAFARVQDFFVTLASNINLSGLITQIRDFVTAVDVSPLLSAFSKVQDFFLNLTSKVDLTSIIDKFKNMEFSFSSFADLARSGMEKIKSLFDNASGPIGKFADSFVEVKAKIQNFLKTGIDLGGLFSGIGDLASQGADIGRQILAGLVNGLRTGGPAILSAIGKLATGLINGFKSVLGIHSPSTAMIPIGVNIMLGIGQGLGTGIKFIINSMSKFTGFIGNAIKSLFSGLSALDIAATLNAILSGGLIIALTKLVNNFGSGGGGGLLGTLKKGFNETFERMGKTLKTFQTGIKAKALLDIALAVVALVGAIYLLSRLDPKQVGIALGEIAVMMALLVGSLKALDTFKGDTNIAVLAASMTLLATSMVILAGAVAIFGNMDLKTLGKGFGAIAIGLGLMVGAVLLLKGSEGAFVSAGAGIVLMSNAMIILAAAVLAFGSMDMSTLAKGLGAMAIGISLILNAFIALATFGGDSVIKSAGAVLIMSAALVVMAIAVATLGNLDMSTLAKGLGAMAIGLGLMVGSLLLLSGDLPGVLAAAGAMAIMAAALVIFAGAVGIFGNMDMSTLAQGFAAVAIGLGLLIAAGFAAQFVAPGLLVLGITLNLIGQAMLYAGAGMLLFSTALGILLGLGAAGLVFISVAIEAFLALLPTIAIQVAASFVTFVETIAKAAPRIRAAFSKIFENMLGVVTDAIPQIGKLLQQLITTGLAVIRRSVPQWIETGRVIIDAFLAAVSKEIPKIAGYALTMINDFLGVIDANLGPIISKGTDIIVTLLEGLGKAAGKITNAAGQTILDILHAIDAAVVTYSTDIRDAGISIIGHLLDGLTFGASGKIQEIVGNIASDVLSGFRHAFGISSPAKTMMPIGSYLMLGMLVGIESEVDSIRDAGQKAGDALIEGLSKGTKDKGAPLLRSLFGEFDAAGIALNKAYELVNAGLNPTGDATVTKAQGTSRTASNNADLAAVKARDAEALTTKLDKEAEKKQKIADKKKATKKQKDAAKAADDAAKAAHKRAETLAGRSDNAQARADAAATGVTDAIAYVKADDTGKADIQAERAAAAAEQARALLSKANDEANRATQLRGKAQIAMAAQAQKHAKAAAALAAQAKAAQEEANRLYAQQAAAEAAADQKRYTDRAAALSTKLAGDQKALEDQIAYDAADTAGKAQIMRDRAAADLARAEAAKALSLNLIEQAKALAATDVEGSLALLDRAEAAAAEAQAVFTEIAKNKAEYATRIRELDAKLAEEAKAAADKEAYDKADAAGKAQILKDRAAADQARADAAKALAASLIAEARALASTDAAGALALLDRAEQAAAEARDAASKAEEERQAAAESAKTAEQIRQQAEALLNQPGSVGLASGGILTASRTSLEDAAKAVDRYTTSLAQASELTGAGQQPVQYVQNVYSPTALSPTEVYRNSKNLLSATAAGSGFS